MNSTIITIVGISLLINNINNYLNDDREFPADFVNSLDSSKYLQLEGKERLDPNKLIPIIKNENEAIENLARFLTIPRNTTELSSYSAETKTLSLLFNGENEEIGIIDEQNTSIVFITSNTPEGKACAEALSKFYKRRVKEARIHVVLELTRQEEQFDKGLQCLLNDLVHLVEEVKNQGPVYLNATGGFKPEASYATLCGLIMGYVDVIYGHEQFSKIVRLPFVPLGVDFYQIHLNSTKILLTTEGKVLRAYKELPKPIQLLLEEDSNGMYSFNEVGRILWNQYVLSRESFGIPCSRWLLTEKIQNQILREKIIEYIKAWENAWVGMQLPQMIDHSETHCQNLLGIAEQLLLQLPDDFLSEREIYVLIASIWLHDIGHSETIEYKDGELPKWLKPNEIRKKHNHLTYQRIKNNPSDFGFIEFDEEAQVIATVCKYHRQLDIEAEELANKNNLHGEKIRPQLLAGLVRLIDACDIGIRRAGNERFRKLRLQITENEIPKFENWLEKIEIDGLKEDLDESLQQNLDEMRRDLEEEIEYRKSTRKHFQVHEKVKGVEIRVKSVEENSYHIDICISPVEKYRNILDEVNDIIGLGEDVMKAAEIVKKYSGGVISQITVGEL